MQENEEYKNDIDEVLNKRASLLLNQAFTTPSSNIVEMSDTYTNPVMIKTTAHEQSGQPMFNRTIEYKTEQCDNDILHQWRLRRRFEQVQYNEPIHLPIETQNASIQTSLLVSTASNLSDDINLYPTRDNDQYASVCYRPLVQIESSSSLLTEQPTVYSSDKSTLTQVTSTIPNDSHEENEIEDYNSDDILNVLKQKRNELLIQF
ncbi:unnamed protein product [Adineta steineri]|uniref:Uncharacterized protein n=1 Tax=Adineta steineri TaxID=433720 RepID=A0A814UKQ7_9BILA|nr:unnamed protein product [Adineta steineri]CAF1196779.1 unnamed protein product [Adineta steineri]CAF1291843.1 unnamed protein product [Adineta steineri]CAF1583280.1 unnamed protein product [Adineta steineri]